MKLKSQKTYENELRKMVEDRTAATIDAFLLAQIRITAQAWRTYDRLCNEIASADSLTIEENGSQGQRKTIVNPLLPQQEKSFRSLMLGLDRLGLNFNATPSKMTESTKKGGETQSPLSRFLKESMNNA